MKVSHISAHNSVRLPTELASSRREKKPAPWADNTYLLLYYSFAFVVPPVAPITEGQCDFYGNGLCTSATTLCSSIGGTCCNIAPCSGNGGAACFGTGLNPGNYGHARIGGSVVEIGGVWVPTIIPLLRVVSVLVDVVVELLGIVLAEEAGLIRNRVNSCTFSLIYLYILYYNLFPKSQK